MTDVRTSLHFCLLAASILLGACPGTTRSTADGGSRDSGTGADSGQATVGCASASECSDGIDCTNDVCGASGACVHLPVPALCSVGSSCDPVMGCVAGAACGSSADCVDTNACTKNETCNATSATCTFTTLDNDGDGEPPRVCGGTDCDDANSVINAAAGEICGNHIDDNCNGIVDSDATADTDENLRYDGQNCGACGHVCGASTYCWDGVCEHCGSQGEQCCVGYSCSTGVCSYSGCATTCGGIGDSCCSTAGGAQCQGGAVCDTRVGSPTQGSCRVCGGPGQPCCGSTCAAGSTCVGPSYNNSCVVCGGANESCCPTGSPCQGGVACTGGTCACGGDHAACCAGNTCTGGRICEMYSGTSNFACHSPSCGGLGEPCCNLACFGGATCTGTQYSGDGGIFPIPGSGTCTP